MGAALLPPRGWAALRRASEAGVSDATLAKKYSVPACTIRKRRMREKWLTQARLEEAKAVALAKGQHKHVASGAVARMSRDPQNEEGTGHVVEEIASLAEVGQLHFARLASKALTKRKTLSVRTMGEAVAAVKGLRTVAGLDKETPVSINIGAWGSGSMRTVGADLYDP